MQSYEADIPILYSSTITLEIDPLIKTKISIFISINKYATLQNLSYLIIYQYRHFLSLDI